jgi:hypothetical protein
MQLHGCRDVDMNHAVSSGSADTAPGPLSRHRDERARTAWLLALEQNRHPAEPARAFEQRIQTQVERLLRQVEAAVERARYDGASI